MTNQPPTEPSPTNPSGDGDPHSNPYASHPPRAFYQDAPHRRNRTDAGVALGLSFLPCLITNVISAVLAIRVLTRRSYGILGGSALGMAIAALCVSAAWLIIGIALLFADIAEDMEEGPKRASELQVGDCIDILTEVTLVEDLPTTSCDQPHDGEVYWTTKLEGRGYPGDQAVDKLARTTCSDHFEPFVGTPLRQSRLSIYYLVPTPESWLWDDTDVVCVVVEPTGPGLTQNRQVTGTLQGSNR